MRFQVNIKQKIDIGRRSGNETFKYKSGNGIMSDVRLICLANNRCKKKELDESLMHLWIICQCLYR